MDSTDGNLWMSIIKNHEQRKCELEEQQCNLEHRLENLKRRISSSQNICSCSQCLEPTNVSIPGVTSSRVPETDVFDDPFPPNSMDMQYITTLYTLISREKELQKQVREMGMREQVLLDSLKRENKSKKFGPDHGDTDRIVSERHSISLKEENARLTAELEDAKLELKHCLEKVHGPLMRSLEQERRMSQQLENDLREATDLLETKDRSYREDMRCLKDQLEEVTQNLAEASKQNENLQRQMSALGRKYKDLHRDLISQKLNEARTLERLNELLSEKERAVVRERKPSSSLTEEKGKADLPSPPLEHNLYEIARSLSKTLQNINQCDICRGSIPGDLREAIVGIKIITDTVNHTNDATKLSPSQATPVEEPPQLLNPAQFRESWPDVTSKTEDMVYDVVTVKNDVNEDVTDATDIPTDVCLVDHDPDEVRIQSEGEDAYVLTEVEAIEGLELQVDTQVELCEDVSEDIHVTTTVTSSGVLEVVTEGPAGVIETTMMRTPSGNLEVVTEITEYPEYLSIAQSGDTFQDVTTMDEEGVALEHIEKVGDFVDLVYESVNDSVEEEEFVSAADVYDIGDNIDSLRQLGPEEDLLTTIIEDEEGNSGKELSGKISQRGGVNEYSEARMAVDDLGRRGAIRSVTSDGDRSKLGRKEHHRKLMSQIPVSASFPYQGPICNCGKCGCLECFGRIAAEPAEKCLDEKSVSLATNKGCNLPDEVSMRSGVSKIHPPDCDCVDCLCDPCASFPPDYATRMHPPGCDCIDCLCGDYPCAAPCSEPIGRYEKEIIVISSAPKPEVTPPSIPVIEHSLPDEPDQSVGDVISKFPEAPLPQIPPTPTSEREPVEFTLPIKEPSTQFTPPEPIEEPSTQFTPPKEAIEEPETQFTPIEEPPAQPQVEKQSYYEEERIPPIKNRSSRPEPPPQGAGEKLPHKPGCDCPICQCCTCPDVVTEPRIDIGSHLSNCSCIDCILVGGVRTTAKNKNEFEDIPLCVDELNCECLDDDATPCQNEGETGQNLLETIKGIISTLQTTNVADMVNELKTQASRLIFGDILDQSKSVIYSCACVGERKNKRGAYLRNPCTCGTQTKTLESDSSSCCCFEDDQSENDLRPSRSTSLCSCTSCEVSKPRLVCKRETPSKNSARPLEITEVRKVSSDGLLIKWIPPGMKDVTGYEVLVDGKVKSKVHTAMRTTAIIYSLTGGSVNLSVYAITPKGRCQPPANAMYQF